jgi:hypothetical protein
MIAANPLLAGQTDEEVPVNPEGPSAVRSGRSAGAGNDVRDGQGLWEQVFSPQNLGVAVKRVE